MFSAFKCLVTCLFWILLLAHCFDSGVVTSIHGVHLCLLVSGSIVSVSSKMCIHLNPVSLLYDSSIFEDEQLSNFTIKWLMEIGIPDISGTVVNAIIR